MNKPALWLLTLLLLAGCGDNRPYQDDSRDPDSYAGQIKSHMVEYLTKAQQHPSTAPQRVEAVIETLSAYPEHAVGDNEATYAQLLADCQALRQLYEAKAQPAKIKAKIEAILALANTLPGELRVGED